MNTPSYGLVGRGRVATHMARYLELEGQPVTRWHRGMQESPTVTLSEVDIVISSTGSREFVVDQQQVKGMMRSRFMPRRRVAYCR